MAYSDYGAYIWKNGENITDECADISCKIIDGKFILDNWYKNLIKEVKEKSDEKDEIKTISGHAVINLEEFCIAFYKTYNPKLYYRNGEYKELEIIKKDYKSKKDKLYIRGYNLGYQTGYFFYEIDYKKDKYCVIVGSAIGKGWDYTPASKYVIKHLILFTRCDGEVFYKIDTKRDTDWDIVFNKLDRLEDIRFEKYWKNKYIKQLFRDILKFNWKHIVFDINEILNHKEKIKWLK